MPLDIHKIQDLASSVTAGCATPHRHTLLKVKSEELLGGRTELVIVHQGREYRLRVTQNGKLILTA